MYVRYIFTSPIFPYILIGQSQETRIFGLFRPHLRALCSAFSPSSSLPLFWHVPPPASPCAASSRLYPPPSRPLRCASSPLRAASCLHPSTFAPCAALKTGKRTLQRVLQARHCPLLTPGAASLRRGRQHTPPPTPPIGFTAIQTTSPQIFLFFLFFSSHNRPNVLIFLCYPFVVSASILYFPLFARFSSIFRVLLSPMIVSLSLVALCA